MPFKGQEVSLSQWLPPLVGNVVLAHSGYCMGNGLNFWHARLDVGRLCCYSWLKKKKTIIDSGAWVLTVQMNSMRLVQERCRR